MQKTLKIVIHCGELTCYSEKKVPCAWVRTRKFGQIYYCSLLDPLGELEENEPGGWVLRNELCLAYTMKGRQSKSTKKGKTLMEVFAEEDKKNEID